MPGTFRPRRVATIQVVAGAALAVWPQATQGQQDCLQWNNINALPPKPLSVIGVAAYDARRGLTVYMDQFGQVGEWNGSVWSVGPGDTLLEFITPEAGQRPTVAFDTQASVILFLDTDGRFVSWDGSRAVELPSMPLTAENEQRRGFAMAYDSDRGVAVVFGGFAFGGSFQNVDLTAEWDGKTWTQRDDLVDRPPARWQHRMTYDENRGVIVMFGGSGLVGKDVVLFEDLWEYDGLAWVERTSGPPGPPGRHRPGLAFDAARRTTVLHAGFDPVKLVAFDDLWEWNGGSWTQRLPDAPAAGANLLIYETSRDRLLRMTGSGGWHRELTGFIEPFIMEQPQSTTVIEGDPLLLSVSGDGAADEFTYQWRKSGAPIEGATSRQFGIGSTVMGDAGLYDVVLRPAQFDPFDCGATTSNPAAVTVVPRIPGDADRDGDFDLDDLADLLPDFTGPGS